MPVSIRITFPTTSPPVELPTKYRSVRILPWETKLKYNCQKFTKRTSKLDRQRLLRRAHVVVANLTKQLMNTVSLPGLGIRKSIGPWVVARGK